MCYNYPTKNLNPPHNLGKIMRPKREQDQPQRELFQVELEQLINLHHPLVQLGMRIDWASFELALGATYHPTQGAPGIQTRLMVALHYLKYQHDLSDENVVAHWVENPYWQHFSGQQFFQHQMPIEPSSRTRWRKRLVKAARQQGLKVKQSYQYAGKKLLLDASCYAHAAHAAGASYARDRAASYTATGEVSQVIGNHASNPRAAKV